MAEQRFAEPIVTRRRHRRLAAQPGADRWAASWNARAGRCGCWKPLSSAPTARCDASRSQLARRLRDPDVMLRLLREKLDALADPLDPGFGFDLIRLEALLAEETKPATVSFDSNENARRQIAFLIDRLAARFGEASGAAFCAAGHPYSRSRRRGGAGAGPRFRPATLGARSAGAGDPPRRPLRLLEKPEEISAVSPRCRTARPAASAGGSAASKSPAPKGPERIAMEWWTEKQGLTARLFPGRDKGRPAFLALSRRAVSSRTDLRRAGICKASSHELCRTGRHHQFSFLRGASPSRRLCRTGGATGLCRHRHRRPQHPGRRGAGL